MTIENNEWLKSLTEEQNEVINQIVAKHKEKWDKELSVKLSSVTELQKKAETEAKAKQELSQKLEEMRRASMSEAERREAEVEDMRLRLQAATEEKEKLFGTLKKLNTREAITKAVTGFKPRNLNHLVSLIESNVEMLNNEDGTSKAIVGEKDLDTYIKEMYENPETSYLFEQNAKTGTGVNQVPVKPTKTKSLEDELQAFSNPGSKA